MEGALSVTFVAGPPPADAFVDLFESTGWNAEYRLTRAQIAAVLPRSWCVLSAWDGARLVGVGRVGADLPRHAMIYDMIVPADRRGEGIGGRILDLLVARCREAGVRDIQLLCARGRRRFYERHGFVARHDDGPGMEWRG